MSAGSERVEVRDRNARELKLIRQIAASGQDQPVLMLNLNCYSDEAGFPHGEIYLQYMAVLESFLPVVGGKILWRHHVLGQPVGDQQIDEILAAWYPSHQAFLDLTSAPGAEENFRLRAQAVHNAVIHRLPGNAVPLVPPEYATV